MSQIRLYLLIFSDDGCESSECLDIESLKRTWDRYTGKQNVTGVIHVGFERPKIASFKNDVQHYRGQMLLTASAKWVCSSICKCTQHSLFEVDGIPLHLALDGWGCQISQDDISEFQLEKPATVSVQQGDALNDKKIKLPENYISIIRSAPTWLLSVSLADLHLRARTFNALNARNIFIVGDLVGMSSDMLLETENFGSTSLKDLTEQLELAIKLGHNEINQPVSENIELTPDEHSKGILISDPVKLNSSYAHLDRLIDVIEAALSKLEPNIAKVVRARMEDQTLDSIGSSLVEPITREGVRQNEKKGIQLIGRDSVWQDVMAKKLSNILNNCQDALPFKGLHTHDDWFEGIENMREPFEYLLANQYILNKKFSLLKINDELIVSRLSQVEWNRIVTLAEETLNDGVRLRLTMSDARNRINDLLDENARELSDEFWAAATKNARFAAETPGEEPLLVSFGRGAESYVESILSEAECPIHFTEIVKRIETTHGKKIAVLRVQQAAIDIALLFGPGKYGLLKHVPLSSDQQSQIRAAVLEIMQSHEVFERQWHSEELFRILKPKFGNELDIYILGVVLKQCTEIKDLGRQVWMLKAADKDGNAERIDVQQAVVSVLENAGAPLSGVEIRNIILKFRGVGSTFQVRETHPVCSLGVGKWGIVGRDD